MAMRIQSWRVWGTGLMLLIGLTTMTFAQLGGGGGPKNAPSTPATEYTQQEVQPNSLVETLNDLGKQRWEVFQVVPIWKFQDLGGGAEMTPIRYQILGRRPIPEGK
jgi:hypothetical protein